MTGCVKSKHQHRRTSTRSRIKRKVDCRRERSRFDGKKLIGARCIFCMKIEVLKQQDKLTLFGSFTSTYLPSGCFMQRSVIVRTMPQPLDSDMLSWPAKSSGRIDAVLKIT